VLLEKELRVHVDLEEKLELMDEGHQSIVQLGNVGAERKADMPLNLPSDDSGGEMAD